MKKIISISLLLISVLYLAVNQSLAQTHDQISIEEFITSNMQQNHIPGSAFAVIKDGQVKWMNGYGYANIDQQSAMDENTILNIASVSKTITAMAIMQLWEENKVDLDADINNYLPISIHNPNHPNIPITIRQLMTHTSSIQDSPAYWLSMSCGDPSISLKEWILNYLRPDGDYFNRDQNFLENAPGETKQYSNVGFGLLAYIIESVSGTPFHQYTHQNIFSPLGMDDTGWFLTEIESTDHAKPYFFVTTDNVEMLRNRGTRLGILPELEEPDESGYFIDTCLYSFPNYSDGMLRTNIRDLSKFTIAMLNKGTYNEKILLQSSTINTMLSLQLPGDERQGLTWFYTGIESIWGHDGQDAGVQSGMFINPELNIGIVYLQNSMDGEVRPVVERLYRFAKESY